MPFIKDPGKEGALEEEIKDAGRKKTASLMGVAP